MPVYMVVDVRFDDMAWAQAYRREVPAMIAKWGGRYLTRPGAPLRLEGTGEAPDTLTLLEFPSHEAVEGFLASPEYAPHAKARQAGTRTTIYLLDGIDADLPRFSA
ncbi:MAG: hypothetical protein RIS94_223 [Pseudomonadota bacterium]|jgi:uncharacterized protein (DUF1330 family)